MTEYTQFFEGAEEPVEPDPVELAEAAEAEAEVAEAAEEAAEEAEEAAEEAEAVAEAAEEAAEAEAEAAEEAAEAAEEAAEKAVEAAEEYEKAQEEGRVVGVAPEKEKKLKVNIDDVAKLRVRETPNGEVVDHITNKYNLAVIDDSDGEWVLVEYSAGDGDTIRGYVKKSFVVEA